MLVLSGIVAVYLLMRRFTPGGKMADHGLLKVVARASLSPKHHVALVRVGEARLVLVGLSSDRVTPLCEVTQPEEVADLLAAQSPGKASADRRVFGNLLQRQHLEFEDADEDVGDSLLADPPSLNDTTKRIGGLRDRLTALRAAMTR